MQEGRNKPTFGIFILRVISILLGVFLFGFIIWAIAKLLNGSSFWGDVFKIVAFIGIPLLIIAGIILLIRFMRTNSVTFNLGRIIALLVGLVVLGFIIWGVIRLADTNDSQGVVTVPDSSSSTTTNEDADSSRSDSSTDDSDDLTVDDFNSDEDSSSSSANEDQDSNTQTDTTSGQVAGTDTTPNTGPTPETMPNTGVESVILPALSFGFLAYTIRRYRASREQLKRI